MWKKSPKYEKNKQKSNNQMWKVLLNMKSNVKWGQKNYNSKKY